MGRVDILLLFFIFYDIVISILFLVICLYQKKNLDTRESLITDLTNELAKRHKKWYSKNRGG